MTTILAGANWTMWPGLTNVSTRTDGVRSHARIQYEINRSDNSESWERNVTPIAEGWLGVYMRTALEDDFPLNNYLISLNDENGDVLMGIFDGDSRSIVLNGPFLSEPLLFAEVGEGHAEFSLNFKIDGTDGFVIGFVNGVEKFRYDGDTRGALGPAIERVVQRRTTRSVFGGGNPRSVFISEVLLSTQPTIGFKVVDTELSVASLSQWDGTPSNITPIGYASVEDSLSTEDADQLVTFSRPDIPALDESEFVASVHFETSQLAETGAPIPEADLLIYDGSEHGAERIQPGASFSEFRVQWDQDPRTSAPWTEAGVNEIEVGVASRTA